MCVYCNPTDSLSKTPDMFPHILKNAYKTKQKTGDRTPKVQNYSVCRGNQ